MKKKIFITLIAFVLVVAGFCLYMSFNTVTSVTDYAMNTQITVTAKGRNSKKAVEAAVKEIKRLDRLMSVSNPESDISKINSAPALTHVKVSEEVYSLIEFSLDISSKTEGAFDITVNPLSKLWGFDKNELSIPSEADIKDALGLVDYRNVVLDPHNKSVMLNCDGMSISLGAVAKGYAADRVVSVLKEYKIKDAIVDLGGNVYVLGKDKKVGIQTPFAQRGEYFKACKVSDTSVVTAGSYERYFEQDGAMYHHIIDPENGYPAQKDLDSCTVICENSALADALSTATFVRGSYYAEQTARDFGVQIICHTVDGRVLEFR